MEMPLNETPQQVRARIRRGEWDRPTAGLCPGYVQANLAVVPKELAYDFLLFCQRNPKPCPVLDVTDAGSPEPRFLAPGADLRREIPRYRVWKKGELVDEPSDVTGYWREDLVSFLIGCSFTFEFPLMEAGIPVHHIEAGRNVPMYDTSIACKPAGRFSSTMVVSMRGIQPDRIADAVRISGYYPSVHGAPVWVGEPEGIGITDLQHPDYGDPPIMEDGDIPVFWACGVTPQAAVMASKPSFAITHAPGRMFLTDIPDRSFMV